MERVQNFGRETSSNIRTWKIEDMRDNIKSYLEEIKWEMNGDGYGSFPIVNGASGVEHLGFATRKLQ
jgi:hypothetical protein